VSYFGVALVPIVCITLNGIRPKFNCLGFLLREFLNFNHFLLPFFHSSIQKGHPSIKPHYTHQLDYFPTQPAIFLYRPIRTLLWEKESYCFATCIF